jgi:hypothetical protein
MPNLRRIAPWGLLLAVTAAIVALGYRRIAGAPLGFLMDDGLFYARIAMQLATTGQSSFDGIHQTSGYHLGWEGVLASLSWLLAPFTVDPHAHMGVFLTLSLFAVFACGFGFARSPLHRLVLIVLALSGHLLLETVPLMLVLLGMSRAMEHGARGKDRDTVPWTLVALAPLVPLLRIDATPAAVVLLLALVADRRWAALRAASVSLAAGVALHFGLMLALFGEPWTVSAMLRGFALLRVDSPPLVFNLLTYGAGTSARSALVIVLPALAAVLAWRHRDAGRNQVLLWLVLGLGGFSVTHLMLSHMRYWYFVPGLVGSAYALARLELPPGTARRVRGGAMVALAVLAIAYLGHKGWRLAALSDAQDATWDFLGAIAEQVPAGEPIFQVDGSGRTGFYSGRAVINGDGLVNDRQYARRLMAGRLGGYLDEEDVCYLIVNRADDGDPLIDLAGLVVARGEVDELLRSDARGRTGQVNYTLYRRQVPACQGR